MRTHAPFTLIGLLALVPALCAEEPPTVQRFALVAGANRGAADRVPLRYAVADAERFAQVLTAMGGVLPADCTVLRDPSRRDFIDALAATRARAAEARGRATRVEVMIYFSGHADERGLMLGRELVPYAELRAAIADLSADVGITILDACASGAITRIKGGRSHPAFLTELPTRVQGYAFLTSSSENEAAQEADFLQGSFFTHALLTGLRGAADVSGDGKVTLGEAYQFAFNETLAQTAPTQAGAQHPAYDIKMAGTGDVVMTDVRENAASLILGTDYDGRFLVIDSHRRLVADLVKPSGRRVELGLEAGRYEIFFEQDKALLASRITLAEGQRQELVRSALQPRERRPTDVRGSSGAPGSRAQRLDGRWRVSLLAGVTNTGVSVSPAGTATGGGTFGLVTSQWAREDLALDLWLTALDVGVQTMPNVTHTSGGWGLLVGARYYPPIVGAVRPYLGGALGPMTQVSVTITPMLTETRVSATRLGGIVGGGADFLIGSHFTASFEGHYTMRSGKASRFDVLLGLGWRFGGGGAHGPTPR